MIIKRVIVIIKNVSILIGLGLKYLAIRALEVLREFRRSEYQASFKKSLDYINNPRYISADYEEQDNMETYSHDNISSRNEYGFPIQSTK